MVIGRLSCGRFAPGSRRVVVVRSLRAWLSDQREALGASLLAPKAPRPSSGPEGLLLSARGLSRRDCKSPFFVFYKGRLAGRFAPGSGRVVVVRSLRSWLPTREGPLEPLSWPRRLLARPPAESSLLSVQGPRGGPASKRLRRRSTSGKPHDPCLFRRGLPNQTTAHGKASCTHEDPSRGAAISTTPRDSPPRRRRGRSAPEARGWRGTLPAGPAPAQRAGVWGIPNEVQVRSGCPP